MPILAALATVPGREFALERCLASLRPQVDRIAVHCNGFDEPPDVVRHLADEWRCDPADTLGSAAKLHWADRWNGLYLGCDDDLEYPVDYAATMLRWVRRWKGKALVTCHGRILSPGSRAFDDVVAKWPPQGDTPGAWLNYPGGCAMAFDTRLNVPTLYGKNLEEAGLAVWAQVNPTPIWLVPHPAKWLKYLLEGSQLPTIWASEKAARFENRNRILAVNPSWKVHRA